MQMAQCQKKKKNTTGKAGACAIKRQRLPGLGLASRSGSVFAPPRASREGSPFVATPPAAHGGSHSGGRGQSRGPGRALSHPRLRGPATGGPALLWRRLRSRWPRGKGEGPAGSPTPRGSAAAAPATILDGGPARRVLPGRDEDNGVGCPVTRRQPDPGPGERDQRRGQRDAVRGGRMAADGARGRALPKHCERVWRRQPGRRREPAFTSGSRRGLAAFPAARAQARDAGSRPCGGPPAARAPGLPLRNAWLESVPRGPSAAARDSSAALSSRLFPEMLPRFSTSLPSALGFAFVSFATPGFSLDACLWAPRTVRAERDAFSRGLSLVVKVTWGWPSSVRPRPGRVLGRGLGRE